MNEQVNYAKIQRIQDDLDALVIGQFGTGFVTDNMLYESGIKTTVASHTSQLADIAYNVLKDGAQNGDQDFDNATIINVVFSKSNICYLPDGTYRIKTNINIPAGKVLSLSPNATIKIMADVDGIYLNNNSRLINGNVIVGISNYSHNAVTVLGEQQIDNGLIKDTVITGQSMFGEGLVLRATGLPVNGDNTKNTFVSFFKCENVTVKSFNVNIHLKATSPTSNQNSAGTMNFVNGNIFTGCISAGGHTNVFLDGVGGSSLEGNQIEIQCQDYAGSTLTHLKLIGSVLNRIDSILWDVQTGNLNISIDSTSSDNMIISNVSYPEASALVSDQGKSTLFRHLYNDFKKQGFDAYSIPPFADSAPSMAGVQDNWLINADKKFKITAVGATTATDYSSNISKLFSPNAGDVWTYNYSTNNENCIITIDCTKNPDGTTWAAKNPMFNGENYVSLIQLLGIVFAGGNYAKTIQLQYSTNGGTTWTDAYNTSYQPARKHCFNSNLYVSVSSNNFMLRLTIGDSINANHIVSISSLVMVLANSYGQAWLNKSGGNMYGNLVMMPNNAVYMYDTNGVRYKLTVSTAGVLTVTQA